MSRELRIVETFVELTAAMVGRLDAIDFLHLLCQRSVELLECDEAGVLLRDRSGRLQVMGSSSERAESLELIQSHIDEGPCYECVTTGVPVSCTNIAEAHDRWPSFAPAALQRGFLAVRTVPMRVGDETIGALNLFRAQTGEIGGSDIKLARGMADTAAIALLQERELRHSETVVAQLEGALSSRVAIEQAKGIIAERAQIDIDEAFERLRDHARQHNIRISEVARQVIDGDLDLGGREGALPA